MSAFNTVKIQRSILTLHHAAGSDIARPHMAGVWIDFKAGKAVVTDGYIMALQDVAKDDTLPNLFIPTSICKTFDKGRIEEIECCYNEAQAEFSFGSVKHMSIEQQYVKIFPWQQLVPTTIKKGSNETLFNPFLFARIGKALGFVEKGMKKGLHIKIQDPLAPICILDNNKIVGLVMPMGGPK